MRAFEVEPSSVTSAAQALGEVSLDLDGDRRSFRHGMDGAPAAAGFVAAVDALAAFESAWSAGLDRLHGGLHQQREGGSELGRSQAYYGDDSCWSNT